ncbi:hypothetical protein STCU_11741 [Strigomonas culicis]|uniref:Uncharacterized protein n=1 Tax=Strigomonas culicis TaxID=28005 RepID=S9THL7_9TRYP|nr:hypothetical protein STCU_11741 [Strigomonas culicis]|eukprot:EPY15828.1 hypothetical protein STCU_11741 [Strigomonas culicis]
MFLFFFHTNYRKSVSGIFCLFVHSFPFCAMLSCTDIVSLAEFLILIATFFVFLICFPFFFLRHFKYHIKIDFLSFLLFFFAFTLINRECFVVIVLSFKLMFFVFLSHQLSKECLRYFLSFRSFISLLCDAAMH